MNDTNKRIQRIIWGLLREWWCFPIDADSDDIAREIMKQTELPINGDIQLVKDRIFGGFACGNDPNCRHAALETGAYTYTSPGRNSPMTTARRMEYWNELIIKENQFIGGGPFCEDAPKVTEKSGRKGVRDGAA